LNSYGIHGRRSSVKKFILVLVAVVFLNGIPMAGVALDENIPQGIGKIDRQLKWSAVDASWDPAESLFELTDNVKIVQGSTVITAENAKIFFIKNASAEQKLNSESVEKFLATGNVRIELENGVATSEKAVYFTETKILTLSGTPAKFVSGDNTITGRTITVDRETGKVTFEGAEAVIFSKDKL
jgi:lipopolysaccharide transport protein LptA